MAAAALGLGSNLGNRMVNLRTALKHLEKEFEVLAASDVFETAPWGVTDQPHFLNACLLVECSLPPESLLALLKDIEKVMGRVETRRWGERVIDLDVLTLGALVYESPILRIPHARMHQRDFVLIPLAQVIPGWVHPLTGHSVSEMALDLLAPSDPLRICHLPVKTRGYAR
ncbi:MAG: 2-amino-4-hydroxy-6-hydroxymethyldihydropteridine diphosphokinase [Synergistaceae bacterium]|jgi:2-amino-4-hydroxy-6-hydroxymethyldihydropteridine diphosphokinase|nr:2-amino-4-hydroxy-6-hydroxymethyldihydropteridine diphosphokinase [Synergistaceae bacterium]